MVKKNRLIAEAVGTFGLVFCGCGAIIVNDLFPGQLGPAPVAMNIQSLWLYLTAPVIGMLAAVPTCRWIQGNDCCADAFDESRSSA